MPNRVQRRQYRVSKGGGSGGAVHHLMSYLGPSQPPVADRLEQQLDHS